MNGFQLDELRIDSLTGEVAGPGGREKLDPKVMKVLVHMAEHAGQVVSREDLLAQLWPHAVVTDDALTRCFYELRRQLSHAGGDERYRKLLETLPKRGYRLNGKVTRLQSKRRTWTMTIAIAAMLLATGIVALYLVLAPDKSGDPSAPLPSSVAVLPFLDMSAEKDQAFFSDGITEEILNRLSQSENLRVISRTSSFSFRDESLDVPQIAERLNVAYVLEGSVRKSNDRVRITAQLIEVSTNSHVWSETYDRGVGDLFAIQDEIASSVATALQVTLAGGKPRGRMPESVDAYERFLQGKFFYNRRTPGDIDRSVKYYSEAVAIDPQYARAYAALAGAYSLLASEGDRADKPFRELQGEAARKSVELDPRLAVAHARLAQYYYHIGEREKGDEHSRTAIALDPDDPLVLGFASDGAVRDGDIGRAVDLWRRIVAKDPLSPTQRANLVFMLLANGQFDEARVENRKVLELHPDAGPSEKVQTVRILVLLERYEEAQAAVADLPKGKYQDYGQALLHRSPGRRAEAEAALKRLAAEGGDYTDRVRLAEVYAFRGMREETFGLLLETQNDLDRGMGKQLFLPWYFRNDLRLSPFLKPLHDDPRWAVLTASPG